MAHAQESAGLLRLTHMQQPDNRAANHRDPQAENHRHESLGSKTEYALKQNLDAIACSAPGPAAKIEGQLDERPPDETEQGRGQRVRQAKKDAPEQAPQRRAIAHAAEEKS